MSAFKLSYPTNTYLVSQGFGENPGFYKDPKYGGIIGHNGLDSFAAHGYDIYATHDGFAHFEKDPAGGCGVVIVSDKEYDYKDGPAYFKTIYWHLVDGDVDSQFKSPIQGKTEPVFVKNGQLIGYADNTGASTGDHLHFGLKPCRKDANGNLYNIEQLNGYLGAIDPNPYFDGFNPNMIQNLVKQVEILQQIVALLQQQLALKTAPINVP